MTHEPEIGSRSRRHKLDARFGRHFFVPVASEMQKNGGDLRRRN